MSRPDVGGGYIREEEMGAKPKPDEGRLLTDKQIFQVIFGKKPIDKEWVNVCLPLYKNQIAQAQLAKDLKFEQIRVERIIKEIEERFFTHDADGNLIIKSVFFQRDIDWWQSLKKQEVKDE